jgi:prepilin-type N-terminal cleavage/methylation domain-containing protein
MRKRSQRGYSLVELMMVVAIVGIMAMVGPTLMIQFQNFFLLTTARHEIQRDSRAVIDIINRFLRQAKGKSIVIDTPSGQGPYSRISFTHVDGRAFSFYQSGTDLVQQVGTKTSVLSKNLVYIAFTFPRSDYPYLVNVSVTMGKAIQLGQRKELELTVQKIRIMN